MLVNKNDLGFGRRSWRYAMVVQDGIIEKMFIEPHVEGDPYGVSDADTLLHYLNPHAVTPHSVAVFAKPGCPYCARAKALLDAQGYDYEEIVVQRDASPHTLHAVTGARTTPYVYIDGTYIGGVEALEAYLTA